MIKWIQWFFSPSKTPDMEETDLYETILELENRIVKLEEENVETSNLLYELMNSLDAVDARIDILTLENWTNKNV